MRYHKSGCVGLSDSSVRILLDAVAVDLHIADRHGEEELAPRRCQSKFT